MPAPDERFITFDNLSRLGVRHFTTTRCGWQSGAVVRFTGDEPSEFMPFRHELAAAMNIDVCNVLFPRQVHSATVVQVTAPPDAYDFPATDALITDTPGLCLCVQSADCVPILLYAPQRRAVAAVHAGWRGTAAGIVTATLAMMQRCFAVAPSQVVAAIGPSIHQPAYAVAADVAAHFAPQFLKPALTAGKFLLNLQEANRCQLISEGVVANNIEIMNLCSFDNPYLLYSARRESINTGRMATGIML